MIKQTGYELSRNWFDFCFENPEKIKPNHTAMYFFAIEHCNRLGWKQKFGFPSQMAMDALGIKNWRTYKNTLNDLIEFGFIEMIEISKNQYSSNIISIKNAYVKNTKALDKAMSKHIQKQHTKQGQSIVSIDKPINNKPITISPKKFYEKELLTANGLDIEYSKFINILFGKNDLGYELSGVLSITKQVTYLQFEKLWKLKLQHKKGIAEVLTSIENDKKYWKGKSDLYRTVSNWLKNDFK